MLTYNLKKARLKNIHGNGKGVKNRVSLMKNEFRYILPKAIAQKLFIFNHTVLTWIT